MPRFDEMHTNLYEFPLLRRGFFWDILTLLLAGDSLIDAAHGLDNLPELLPHFIFCPFCCQAMLILPNPHHLCCPLPYSNCLILSPEADL